MTSSVSLRALEPEDLQLVLDIENDASLWKWASNTVPVSRYTVRQYLERQQADIYADGELRQVVLVDGKPAGIVDLTDFSPRHLRAEVAIVLLPSYRRQGIGSQALRLLHTYATSVLRLRSLYAYVAQENLPAQALFRSVGYTPSGLLQRWLEGEHEVTLFQLLL